MNSFLHSPYLYCGTVIARTGAAGGTLLWSILVIGIENAFRQTSYGGMLPKLHENIYAAILGLLSCVLLYRLWKKRPPSWLDAAANAGIVFWWGFIVTVLLLFQRPMYPTTAAAAAVVLGLAVFGFVSPPKGRARCDIHR